VGPEAKLEMQARGFSSLMIAASQIVVGLGIRSSGRESS